MTIKNEPEKSNHFTAIANRRKQYDSRSHLSYADALKLAASPKTPPLLLIDLQRTTPKPPTPTATNNGNRFLKAVAAEALPVVARGVGRAGC